MHAKKGSNLSVAAMQKKMHSKGTTPAMKKKLVFALNARKWKKEDGGLVERYDLGGWIKENSQGLIGAGKFIGGALLTGATFGAAAPLASGLMMSGVSDIAQEVTDGNQGKTMSNRMAALQKQQLANVQAEQVAVNQGNVGNIPTFNTGGFVSGNPMDPRGTPVELEDEMTQGPDGSFKSFRKLPKHKNAGPENQMSLEPGTRVFPAKYAAEVDAIRKEIEKYEQILYS